MEEKRRYPRYPCKIKAKFNFYEGNPDDIDYDLTVPSKGSGTICDISEGGACIITRDRVAVGSPALVNFKAGRDKFSVPGRIVRTGLLQNNPTEVAKRLAAFSSKGDAYIAVEFKEPIQLDPETL